MRRLPATLALAGLLSLCALAQEQEWYKYYEEAEKAAKSGQWTVTVNNLVNYCLKKYPRPKRNAQIYSHFYMDYKPYILLVEAYFNLRKYEAAKEYLDQQLENIELKEFGRDSAYVAKYNVLKEKVNKAFAEAASRPPVGPEAPARDPAVAQAVAQAEDALRRGDYPTAQRLFTQARDAKGDPDASKKAASALDDIERELRNWENGRAFFQAGQHEKAVPCLQVVVAINRFHAAEAQRMLEQSNAAIADAKARSQSLQEVVADIRNYTRQGSYEMALETGRRAAQKYPAADDVRKALDEVKARLADEARSAADGGNLDKAVAFVTLGEKYFAGAAEFRPVQAQIQRLRRVADVRRLVDQKRWKEAEGLLRQLETQQEFQAEARKLLKVIADKKAALDRNLAQARERLKSGDTEQAARLTEAARADFPESPEAQDLLRQIRDLRQKSGNMETEEYLRNALEEYFDSGDYRKVRFLLDEYLKRGDCTRREIALFFRACAAVCIHRLEGDEARAMLESARKDIASLPAGFQAPRKWVSPAVMALFDRWKSGR
ncbi:MAG: hypothetical protein KA419_07815 [Acidobacteria bacterium]|nr:hypothetical protein [Acidobacteriota bacterium]